MNKRRMKRAWIIPFITILVMSGICMADAPVAEKPSYSEGDYWVLVNKNKFKEIKHTFLREDEDSIVCALNGSDKTFEYHFTSKLKRAPVGYPDAIIDFPIAVGKKWNYSFQRKEKKGPKLDRIRADYKVETYEPVTVAAGTFNAFKITAVSEATERGIITMPQKDQYWYSPDVKYIIKRINRKGDTWELKEYSIK